MSLRAVILQLSNNLAVFLLAGPKTLKRRWRLCIIFFLIPRRKLLVSFRKEKKIFFWMDLYSLMINNLESRGPSLWFTNFIEKRKVWLSIRGKNMSNNSTKPKECPSITLNFILVGTTKQKQSKALQNSLKGLSKELIEWFRISWGSNKPWKKSSRG